MPPRVLMLNWRGPDDPLAGGAENYVMSVCRRLVERGYPTTLVCRRPHGMPREDSIDGVRVLRMGSKFTLYVHVAWAYAAHLRGEYDVIVESINGVPFFSPLYAHIPVIAIVHHITGRIFFEELPLPLALLGYFAERSIPLMYRSAVLAAVSESTRGEMVRLGARDVVITGEGIELPERLPPVSREPEPTIIYLGRVKRYKRLELLIEACHMLRERHPRLSLWVVGTGDALETTRHMVMQRRWDEWVVFYGFADERTKSELLSRAWVFATPTSKEGFGLTVIEANAHRLPAVGFDVPGIRDSIRDGYSGLLVKEQSAHALSRALDRIVSDDGLREKLSWGAAQWARRFSWDAVTDVIEGLIKRCVNEDGADRTEEQADTPR